MYEELSMKKGSERTSTQNILTENLLDEEIDNYYPSFTTSITAQNKPYFGADYLGLNPIQTQALFGYPTQSATDLNYVDEDIAIDDITDSSVPSLEREFQTTIDKINGYELKEDGLYKYHEDSRGKKELHLSYAPVMLSGKGNNVDSGFYLYEIKYIDVDGLLQVKYYTMDYLLDKSKLKELSKFGLNVTAGQLNHLADYFSTSMNYLSKDLPELYFADKIGWKNNFNEFVCGDQLITKDDVKKVICTKSEMSAVTSQGRPEDWVSGVSSFIQRDIVRFKCYVAASAALLKHLNVGSFIVDHAAETTQAKTLGCSVALSMFCNPYKMMKPGTSTTNFVEDYANTFNDFPILVDETSTQDPDNLKDLSYIIANGVGKGRAKKDGSARQSRSWKCVVFTTGEKPIVNTESSFGGQEVRVISLTHGMEHIPEEASAVEGLISETYGHISVPYIQRIIQKRDDLKSLYQELVRELSKDVNRTAARKAKYFAAIGVAGSILEEIFDEIDLQTVDSKEIVWKFFSDSVLENPILPQHLKVLPELLNVEGLNEVPIEANSDYIQIEKSYVNSQLKEYDFNAKMIANKWDEDGITQSLSDRSCARLSKYDEHGKRPPAYKFDIQRCREQLREYNVELELS